MTARSVTHTLVCRSLCRQRCPPLSALRPRVLSQDHQAQCSSKPPGSVPQDHQAELPLTALDVEETNKTRPKVNNGENPTASVSSLSVNETTH